MTAAAGTQLVSVVIPVLNGASRIGRAIETALAQREAAVEVVVVDDGSTDDLEGALAPYRSKITLVRHDAPMGASASRNDGFARSRGTVIAFLDHDDWWPDDLLSLAHRVEPGLSICYDLYRMRETADGSLVPDGRATEYAGPVPVPPRVGAHQLELLADGAPILKSLVHRDDVERIGGYDVRFYGVEDYHFHVKLVAAGVTLELVRKPKGYYRVHGDSTTAAISNTRCRLEQQVRASATWALMYRRMPVELPMSQTFARTCHDNARYWAMRHWKAVLIQSLRMRSARPFGDASLIREAVPGLLGAGRQAIDELLAARPRKVV